MARLIIVCGLPCSGKTTLARQLETDLSAIRLCPDEWMNALGISVWETAPRARIERFQWQFAQTLLARGVDVIIEWGTWARSERDALRTGARALGASVELRFLDAPLDTLLDRLRRRNAESPPVAMDDLRRWDAMFERPEPEELALFDA